MLIKNRLRLAALLPVVFGLLIGSILWVAAFKVGQVRQQAELAEQTLRSNFELNTLIQEYLLYGGTRVESQLQLRQQSSKDLLAQLTAHTTEERELIAWLRQGHEELGDFYRRLMHGRLAAREQIAGALLVKAQDTRAKTQQLADIQRRQMVDMQQLADALILAAVAVLVSLSVLLMALLARRLGGAITVLSDGVLRIGAGDFEHQITLARADELGGLAQAFNHMSRRLRDSFTSVDSLKEEVSRRQQAEQEVRRLNAELETRVQQRTAELETANHDLDGFSYSVSHDLRGPLRAIDGFSLILLDDYSARLDNEGRRLLHVVRDNTVKMARLIDDILLFSRAGRLALTPVAVDMDALVRSVWDELTPHLGARNIKLEVGALPRACGDRSALVQVLVNLLANAAKFTRPRDPAVIEVGGSAGVSENIYYVKDNGVGFDMQYAPKLFGVFQRLHGADEFEGTGIGLAIVKRIISMHGGRVWAEGRVNEGATFFFALPQRQPCPGDLP